MNIIEIIKNIFEKKKNLRIYYFSTDENVMIIEDKEGQKYKVTVEKW